MNNQSERLLKFRIRDKKTGEVLIGPLEFWHLGQVFKLNGWDDKIIFEQFIGLQDKNGADIFEGDYLKLHFDLTESDVEWAVEKVYWDGRLCGFYPFSHNYAYLLDFEIVPNENPSIS